MATVDSPTSEKRREKRDIMTTLFLYHFEIFDMKLFFEIGQNR